VGGFQTGCGGSVGAGEPQVCGAVVDPEESKAILGDLRRGAPPGEDVESGPDSGFE